jgi:hypothetical protein
MPSDRSKGTVTQTTTPQVVVTWNGQALEHGEWIVAGPDGPSELKVAPRADSPIRTADAIRCYVDGQPLTPSAVAFDSADYELPKQAWFDVSRRLEVRFVDAANGHELVALTKPLRIISRRSVQLGNWLIASNAALLILISWRVWDLKVTSNWSQAAGAATALMAAMAALLGSDWWRDGATGWLKRRTSQPRHLGIVALICGGALLAGGLIVSSFVRVVHNATDHPIKVTWTDEGEELLKPGAAEAVWSSYTGREFVSQFFTPMLKSASSHGYCDAADEHCKRFRPRQEGLTSLQALFSLAPVVSIGCVRRPWEGLPHEQHRVVEPLGSDCSPDRRPHTVELAGGAQGTFSYRERESVEDIVRRPRVGDTAPPRLWVTVHAAVASSESANGTRPERVRVSVTATDDGSFREATSVTPLGDTKDARAPSAFPVPSLRRAHATRIVLAPEHGAAFGTLTCHPRNHDVDLWIVPAATGSILRVQLADKTGRTHSSWSADASQVGAGGSPVFGLCLPTAPPDSRADTVELTVVVRELDRMLEPTSFVLPSQLAKEPIIRVVGETSGTAHEVGKLKCDASCAAGLATIVMADSSPTAQQVSLLDDSRPAAADSRCERKEWFSSWTAARDRGEHAQMFHCLWRPDAPWFRAKVIGPPGSARWTFQTNARKLEQGTTPACTLNPRYEFIKACPEPGRDAELFWGKAAWQAIRRDLKPVGCTLHKARVCL